MGYIAVTISFLAETMFTCHSSSVPHISLRQMSCPEKGSRKRGAARKARFTITRNVFSLARTQSRASDASKSRTRCAPDGSPTSKPQTQRLREAYGEASFRVVRLAARRLEESGGRAGFLHTVSSVPKLGRASDAQRALRATTALEKSLPVRVCASTTHDYVAVVVVDLRMDSADTVMPDLARRKL